MNPPIEIDCVPTRKETAERLRVSVRTLSRMGSRGELSPGIKIGARFRLSRFYDRAILEVARAGPGRLTYRHIVLASDAAQPPSAKTKAPASWLAGAKIRSGVVN